MKIYFDTEFDSLESTAGLISIGFATENGEVFYAELSDTYDPARCSPFCTAHVLPLLEGIAKPLPEVQAALSFWLQGFGQPVELISDCWRDVVQLAVIFPDGLPPGVTARSMTLVERWKRRFKNLGGRHYRRHGLRHHHAGDDAIANRGMMA